MRRLAILKSFAIETVLGGQAITYTACEQHEDSAASETQQEPSPLPQGDRNQSRNYCHPHPPSRTRIPRLTSVRLRQAHAGRVAPIGDAAVLEATPHLSGFRDAGQGRPSRFRCADGVLRRVVNTPSARLGVTLTSRQAGRSVYPSLASSRPPTHGLSGRKPAEWETERPDGGSVGCRCSRMQPPVRRSSR